MVLLDTDIWTLAFFGHPRVSERLLRVDANEVALSVITRIEILQGRFEAVVKAADGPQLVRALARLEKSEQKLKTLRIVPFDERAIAEFDRLRQDRKLKKIGRPDLLIACTALAHKATLVTRNLRHFQLVPGLQVENWAD